jgi:hypothetical protein
VPPLTRKVAPLDPESAPEPKFDVPPTPVRLTAFVPPLELMLAKVAVSVTAFATIADPPAVVLVMVDRPPVLFTVIVPPVVAFNAMPLLRWIDSELNCMVAPEAPAQLTAVTPLPDVVALVVL